MIPITECAGEIYRINPEVWAKFKSMMPNRIVTDQTTDLQAGFMLGITYVLEKIEQGLVVG